jgi:hypothetical protein
MFDSILAWSHLLPALAPVALVLLLAVGRSSATHAARSLAWGALVALLLEVPAFAVQLVDEGTASSREAGFAVATAVYWLATGATSMLAIGAWTVLLAAALRVGDRARTIGFTLAFVLAEAIEYILLVPGFGIPLADAYRRWMAQLRPWGGAVMLALVQLHVLVVAICVLFPPSAPTAPTGATGSAFVWPDGR